MSRVDRKAEVEKIWNELLVKWPNKNISRLREEAEKMFDEGYRSGSWKPVSMLKTTEKTILVRRKSRTGGYVLMISYGYRSDYKPEEGNPNHVGAFTEWMEVPE